MYCSKFFVKSCTVHWDYLLHVKLNIHSKKSRKSLLKKWMNDEYARLLNLIVWHIRFSLWKVLECKKGKHSASERCRRKIMGGKYIPEIILQNFPQFYGSFHFFKSKTKTKLKSLTVPTHRRSFLEDLGTRVWQEFR